ncbi:MAG: hypothetical protein ACI8VI_001803 [Granulosicoccus sp.]|jgi:hypothetical protein
MFDWLTQSNYLLMFMQVLITLLLVPLFSFKRLSQIAKEYGVKTYPSAKADVEDYLQKASKTYKTTVAVFLILAIAIVLHAATKQIELFDWDDQSGLTILYLIAMVPVIVMVFIHKKLFGVLKKHEGSKRSASLKAKQWIDYLSRPIVAMVLVGQITLIATVVYFVSDPFDGFAGYVNLLGLLVLDVVFIGIFVVVYRDNNMFGIQNPDHRDALKRRVIQVNMLIWILATLQISLSMWVSGSGLLEYKLAVQSLYLQVILVITAFALTLPKSMFNKRSVDS